MRPRRFAERTAVPAERSRMAIERTLTGYGATRFGVMTEPDRATVYFQLRGRELQWGIPLPTEKTHRTEAARDQERRRRWRVMLLTLKATIGIRAEWLYRLVRATPQGQSAGGSRRGWSRPRPRAARRGVGREVMISSLLFRVQDGDGRGPWRPSFSRKWIDADGPPLKAPFYEEFGWPLHSVAARFFPGEHGGCGCRTLEQLAEWFTAREQWKLERFGYRIAAMVPDRVLAESENQVVFARRLPLWQGIAEAPWSYLTGVRSRSSNGSGGD